MNNDCAEDTLIEQPVIALLGNGLGNLKQSDRDVAGAVQFIGGARELGTEGLDEFCETKHVHWDFNMEDKSYWYPYGK